MQYKQLLAALVLICSCLTASGQGQLLEGDWQLLPDKSAQIDLFNKLKLKISYADKEILVERIWGSPSREFRDTFNLKVRNRKQTEVVNSRVFPTNVFMGMKVNEGQQRELTLNWKPGDIVMKIDEKISMINQLVHEQISFLR